MGSGWTNTNVQPFHEEVIRKNNEIIRNFTAKLAEAFSRMSFINLGFEEYDNSLKNANESTFYLMQRSLKLGSIMTTYSSNLELHTSKPPGGTNNWQAK